MSHLRKVVAVVVVGAVVLVLGVAHLHSQDTTKSSSPATAMMESLIKAAQGLEYDTQVAKHPSTGEVLRVVVKRPKGGWVHIYRSGRPGWVVARIVLSKVEGAAPLDKLAGLLAANDETDPAYFGYSKATNILFLETPIASKSIDTRTLERAIAHLDAVADRNVRLWHPKMWGKKRERPSDKD